MVIFPSYCISKNVFPYPHFSGVCLRMERWGQNVSLLEKTLLYDCGEVRGGRRLESLLFLRILIRFFFFFWLHWVFVAAGGLSLVVNGGYSLVGGFSWVVEYGF